MPPGDDTEDRVAQILAEVDREVARRRARTEAVSAEAAAPPAPATPAPAPPGTPHLPDPAGDVPVPAPEPVAVPAPAAATFRAPAPLDPAELASGIAAARRRLAILNAQLDELAGQVAALADQTPGGAARLPGAPVPAPQPMAPEPVATEPEPEPAAPADAAPETPPARPIAFGMSVRPRPPAQHRSSLTAADRARLVAVELAVAGQRRGDVERVLRDDHPETERGAILDSLFGVGSRADARMRGT